MQATSSTQIIIIQGYRGEGPSWPILNNNSVSVATTKDNPKITPTVYSSSSSSEKVVNKKVAAAAVQGLVAIYLPQRQQEETRC